VLALVRTATRLGNAPRYTHVTFLSIRTAFATAPPCGGSGTRQFVALREPEAHCGAARSRRKEPKLRRSTDRILSSNAGSLPFTERLQDLYGLGEAGRVDYVAALPEAVAEIVRQQAEIGLDVVNDGEFSKREGFQMYAPTRLTGIERHPRKEGQRASHAGVTGRDQKSFPAYFGRGGNTPSRPRSSGQPGADPYFCVGPISYAGGETIRADIAALQSAVSGLDIEPYLPVVSPSNIEHWLWNEYYPDDEAMLFALADALHDEYHPIADAGIIVQVDNPDIADGWQMYPEMDYEEYRRYAEIRVEAINHALRGIPPELVRMHVCWGSTRGPHQNDIPLAEIAELILKVNAQCYSIEAANPRHEHEWRVWEDVELPDDKILMPGVVSHVSDHIEHPELVAWRLELFANCIGRENLIAGTDCGMVRATPAEVCWAKLASLTEGARLASERLWRH
jgi:5-methyltetrahydropteroyltriglutamate--homocysteine methyltransferase